MRELGSKGGVHISQAVDEGFISGPDVISCSRALAQTGGDDDPRVFQPEIALHLSSYSYFCDGPWECRKAVRKVARDGGRVVKFYASGTISGGKELVPCFTLDEVKSIVEESHRVGLKVSAHAHGEEALTYVVDAGVDSIEHGMGLTAHIAREIAKKGIFYVPTLAAYTGKSYSDRKVEQLVRTHLEEDLNVALEQRVNVAVGSDIVGDEVRPHGRNFEEIVMEGKFLGNEGALVAATSGAARCLGSPDIGMLKEAFKANVIVVRGNPIADLLSLAPENILYVVTAAELMRLQ